ncbi:hypothetical protein SMICM17S_01345 [Streptomyces microflavus]
MGRLPIHWGTFNLAPHAWAEPAEWTKDAAEEAEQAAAFPGRANPWARRRRPVIC